MEDFAIVLEDCEVVIKISQAPVLVLAAGGGRLVVAVGAVVHAVAKQFDADPLRWAARCVAHAVRRLAVCQSQRQNRQRDGHANHGFFCDHRSSYNAQAATDAWIKTKELFDEQL